MPVLIVPLQLQVLFVRVSRGVVKILSERLGGLRVGESRTFDLHAHALVVILRSVIREIDKEVLILKIRSQPDIEGTVENEKV